MGPSVPACTFHLIGHFAIAVANRPAQFKHVGKKACALLAYLAMQPQFSASREKLADLLWPDRGDAAARHSLRQCLVKLKQEINPIAPGLLSADSHRVALRAEGIAVDARELMRGAMCCDSGFDPRAVELHDGEFLEGLTLDSEPFNTWIDEQREKLQTARIKLLQTTIVHFNENGNLTAAIDAVERLCKVDPMREDWQRQLLQLYANRNGREHALAYARRWLTNLKRDIDANPEPATIALIEQIKESADTTANIAVLTDAISAAGASLVPGLPGSSAAVPHTQYAKAPPLEGQFTPSAPAEVRKARSTASLDRIWPSSSVTRVRLTTFAGGSLAILLCAVIALILWSRDEIAANVSSFSDANIYLAITPPQSGPATANHQVGHLCGELSRQLSRLPSVKIVTSRGANPQTRHPSFILDCKAQTPDGGLALILTDNVDGVRIWDSDLNMPDQFETDPLHRAAREIMIGMTQAQGRHPGYAASESTKLIREARAAQAAGPTVASHELTLRFYEQALSLEPTSREATLGVAGQLVVARNNVLRGDRASLERSERLLLRTLAEAPNSALAHRLYGVLLEDLGQYEAAVRAFRRALELNPGDPVSYAHIGHAMVLKGDLRGGLEQITRAIHASPNDIYASVWCVFAGEAELELGHVAAATAWFMRGMTLSPDYVRARGWLAAAYILGNNRAAAVPLMRDFRRRLQLNSIADLHSMLREFPEAGLPDNRPQLLRGLELAAAAAEM